MDSSYPQAERVAGGHITDAHYSGSRDVLLLLLLLAPHMY
jgi:hypothetical protein